MGVDSGFEGAVPCQVAEYPSSSMQAPRQHVMSKADTEITMSVLRRVPLSSCYAFGEVATDRENGLFVCSAGNKTPWPWVGRMAPRALLLSDSFPEPPGVKLPGFFLGFFQATPHPNPRGCPSWSPRTLPWHLREALSESVSGPICKAGRTTVPFPSLKQEPAPS